MLELRRPRGRAGNSAETVEAAASGAARARGRNGRLDICGSVRFAETVLDDAIGADVVDSVEVNEDHVAVAKALQVSTERASLKRVRNKRLTKKRRRGATNDVTASLASLHGLNDKPIKTHDAALEELVSNGATLPELEAAIRASGGGLRGREKTWERCIKRPTCTNVYEVRRQHRIRCSTASLRTSTSS